MDNHSVEIIPGYTLCGSSVAASHTGFFVREFPGGLLLDCGYLPKICTVNTVLITHLHCDHCSRINDFLINIENAHPQIFCPAGKRQIEVSDKKVLDKDGNPVKTICEYPSGIVRERLRKYIDSYFAMTKHTETPRIHNKYTLNGVDPDDKIPVYHDAKLSDFPSWYAKIIKCSHTVPCIGYGLINVRKKLRAEYIGLPANELTNMKFDKDNKTIDIYEIVEHHMFCFLGDTNDEVLYEPINKDEKKTIVKREYNKELEKYKTIIIECTFLYSEHLQNAIADGHMHWSKLEQFIKDHPNIKFILIHFSKRYNNSEIIDFFSKVNLKNIVPFVKQDNYSRKNSDKKTVTDVKTPKVKQQKPKPKSKPDPNSKSSAKKLARKEQRKETKRLMKLHDQTKIESVMIHTNEKQNEKRSKSLNDIHSENTSLYKECNTS